MREKLSEYIVFLPFVVAFVVLLLFVKSYVFSDVKKGSVMVVRNMYFEEALNSTGTSTEDESYVDTNSIDSTTGDNLPEDPVESEEKTAVDSADDITDVTVDEEDDDDTDAPKLSEDASNVSSDDEEDNSSNGQNNTAAEENNILENPKTGSHIVVVVIIMVCSIVAIYFGYKYKKIVK